MIYTKAQLFSMKRASQLKILSDRKIKAPRKAKEHVLVDMILDSNPVLKVEIIDGKVCHKCGRVMKIVGTGASGIDYKCECGAGCTVGR